MSLFRKAVLASAMLALLAGFLSAPATSNAQHNIALSLSAPSVKAGETITCAGSGFAEEVVAYWATAPDLSVLGGGSDTAIGGQVTLDFHVPRDAISGRWSLTAYGLQSKTPVVATFEVFGRAPGSVAPAASVEPNAAPAGSALWFHATGFDKREHVSWWVTAPDNTIRDSGPEAVKADSKGKISFRWSVPANAQPGRWVMTMQGYDSSVARAVAFEVR